MISLWVDDSKPAPPHMAVARTYNDALHMLRTFTYEELYLDYDLGEDRTGYDLLLQIRREGICPSVVKCISWNSEGKQKIESII